MPWKVELNKELDFIDMIYDGVVTPFELKQSEAEALKLAKKELPTFFLSDALNAETTISIVEFFSNPKDWATAGLNRRNRLALVAKRDGELWSDMSFYETTCINQGWNVKLFSNREEAIDWLTEK